MNVPEVIECPSCKNEVWPERRKLPGAMDAKKRVGSPILAFGNFCPVVGCGFRLDDAIAAWQNAQKSDDDPSIEVSEENPIEPVKPTPKRVVPIRQTKESEDLFDRIRREHEDAVRKERELTARLSSVKEKRERLDRLMAAMEQSPIAAE